jgi:catechol 2,3-dioxygenase-like lactoylglutathione lyase family enzyme
MLTNPQAVYLFLYVRDMTTARRFYEEILGLPILEAEDRAVKYDTGEIILALNLASEYSIPLSGEKDRSQLIVFHVDDLDSTRQALEEKGVSFTGPTERYEIGATATFYDPDGHYLLLYEPSEESMTWPSGDKIREILAADSRDHTILRVLEQHRSAAGTAPAGKSILGDSKMLYIFNFVTDLERAKDFYAGKLGLEVLEEDEGVGVVKYDAGGILLSTHLVETQANASRREHMDVARSSALVFLVPDVRSQYQRLQQAGISFETPVTDGEIGAIARFRDPDGHVFYLYEPSAAAWSWPSGTKMARLAEASVGHAVESPQAVM